MHECASVLRINLWRKGGIVSKLAQGPWFEFNPKHNETVIYPNQLSFDPEARDSSEDGRLERRVETHFQTYGAVLHTLKEMVYADHDDVRSDQDQALRREFNFSGSVSGFSDIKVGRWEEINPLLCCLYSSIMANYVYKIYQGCCVMMVCFFLFSAFAYLLFLTYIVLYGIIAPPIVFLAPCVGRWKIFSEKVKALLWTHRSLGKFFWKANHTDPSAYLACTTS